MKLLVIGAALAALVAPHGACAQSPRAGWSVQSPGALQLPYEAYGAVTPFGSPNIDAKPAKGVAAAREAALRECSAKARAYTQTTWALMEVHQFRTCMMQHGQPE